MLCRVVLCCAVELGRDDTGVVQSVASALLGLGTSLPALCAMVFEECTAVAASPSPTATAAATPAAAAPSTPTTTTSSSAGDSKEPSSKRVKVSHARINTAYAVRKLLHAVLIVPAYGGAAPSSAAAAVASLPPLPPLTPAPASHKADDKEREHKTTAVSTPKALSTPSSAAAASTSSSSSAAGSSTSAPAAATDALSLVRGKVCDALLSLFGDVFTLSSARVLRSNFQLWSYLSITVPLAVLQPTPQPLKRLLALINQLLMQLQPPRTALPRNMLTALFHAVNELLVLHPPQSPSPPTNGLSALPLPSSSLLCL
jgi:hypothetical protein